ncbi:MAG: HAMP domain-containing histidine kinase [Phycisphaerales bacterium]|nr:HAMP domain-containing histidine kinase [Phycisphaerales bacterium]
MSLRWKFGLLLSIMGAALAVGLLASHFTSEQIHDSLSREYRDIDASFRQVNTLESAIGDWLQELAQSPLQDSPGDSPNVPATDSIHAALNDLRQSPEAQRRVGSSSLDILEQLVAQAAEAPRTPETAEHYQHETHRILEILEKRLLGEADSAIDLSDRLRGLHRWVILGSGVFAILTGVLALMLVRRWVVEPVARLRHATDEIARGQLSYRVAVDGKGELADLAADVNRMASALDEAQRRAIERERLAAMGSMVQRLAHNIRNPLSGIRGLAEVTSMVAQSDTDTRVVENQQEIIRVVDRFNAWLTDLLTKSAPTAVDPRPNDIRAWASRVVDAHRAMASRRGVDIQCVMDHAEGSATFDASHMEHALTAILTNAIQASPDRSRVVCTIEVDRESERWTIGVTDSGPGIPDAVRPRIFEAYFTTKPDGTGIGLAVANHVVHLHRGEIAVGDAPGGGARIEMVLPLNGPAEENNLPAENNRTNLWPKS